MTAVLSVEGLGKQYRGFNALTDVSLEVCKGQVFGLLGPNGSGKSTCLHSITGILGATTGRVTVAGRDAHEPEAKLAFGFVPDDLALPVSLTGDDYLAFIRNLRALPPAARGLQAELLELLQLEPAMDRLVSEYSHGMKRKLQLVAALMHRPRLLILDEPFRGLDPEAAVLLRSVLAAITAQGGAVLVATHDMALAERICDSVAILCQGRVAAQGRPAELCSRYARTCLEQVFLVATGLEPRALDVSARVSDLDLVGDLP